MPCHCNRRWSVATAADDAHDAAEQAEAGAARALGKLPATLGALEPFLVTVLRVPVEILCAAVRQTLQG